MIQVLLLRISACQAENLPNMIYCIARCIACSFIRLWVNPLMSMHGILRPILPPSALLPKFLVRAKSHAGPLLNARFRGSRTSWAVAQRQRRSIVAWLAGNGRTWSPRGNFCSRPMSTVAGMRHPLMTRDFLRAKRKWIARMMQHAAKRTTAKSLKRVKGINVIPIRHPSGMNRKSGLMSQAKTKPPIRRQTLQCAKSSSQEIIQGTMLRRLLRSPKTMLRPCLLRTITIPPRVKLKQTTLPNRAFLAITHLLKTFRPRPIRHSLV